MGLHKDLSGALKAVKEKLDTIPNNIAKEVKANSEQVTPVKTGTLKNGYKIKPSSGLGDDAVIENDVPYAKFVEFGTSKQAPKGMMRYGVSTISEDAKKYVG